MKNLVVSLGYNPNDDGEILPILEARLQDAIKLCRENPGTTLLLMGGTTFRNTNPSALNQSLIMKKYIEDNAPDILANTEIITESSALSTVAELAFLREFLQKQSAEKITVIASEFFVERVKLYSEYIFPEGQEVNFVASQVPTDEKDEFGKIEMDKLEKGRRWLEGHVKGDYQTILREQKEFETKIITGEIKHPISRSFKPR